MRIKALIFDMDGVILNSMPMHIAIWKKIFQKRKLPKLTLKEFEKYNGTSTKEIAEKIIKKYNLKEKPDDIVKEKRKIEEKMMDKKIRLFPDALPSIKKLRKSGYKLAIATSAMPPMVRYVRKRFKLQKYFDTIVYSAQVKHSKPAPDLFLLASKKLEIKPEYCAVVEDALNGIEAANKAGMTSIAITNTFKKEVFKGKADYTIKSLDEIQKIIGDE